MGLTDLANVDLQHSIKCDIDPSNFPRKSPTGCDGLQVMAVLSARQSTGSIPRSSFNNFFFTKS